MYAKLPFIKQEMFNIDKIRATCHCFGGVFVYIEHFRHLQKIFRYYLFLYLRDDYCIVIGYCFDDGALNLLEVI